MNHSNIEITSARALEPLNHYFNFRTILGELITNSKEEEKQILITQRKNHVYHF